MSIISGMSSPESVHQLFPSICKGALACAGSQPEKPVQRWISLLPSSPPRLPLLCHPDNVPVGTSPLGPELPPQMRLGVLSLDDSEASPVGIPVKAEPTRWG